MTASSTQTAIQDLTGDYQIDAAHSRLGFTARHAMVTKVRGSFGEFDGTAHLDAANPAASTATVRIQAASINTGNEQRDAHLRSADFFNTEANSQITFVSTAVEAAGDDTYRLVGDLTIGATTKPVTITFEYTGSAKDPYGNLRAGFEGTAEINRKDWGVNWNAALEAGGLLVSEKVKLEFDISAIKVTPAS